MSFPSEGESPRRVECSDAGTNCLDTVIALYEFPGTQYSHLPLTLGDTIYVVSKHESGWWDGAIFLSNGTWERGWFPSSYVRSVNYIQPVSNRLQSKKEIDSITAANTAANVLIPQMTSLLPKNLGDSARESISNTRKNSVVSFASSGVSVDGKHHKEDLNNPFLDIPSYNHETSLTSTLSDSDGSHATSSVSSTQASISHILTSTEPLKTMEVTEISLKELEVFLSQVKEEDAQNLIWVPRMTDTARIVYYCEYLGICYSKLPQVAIDQAIGHQGVNWVIPSEDSAENASLVQSPKDLCDETSEIDILSSRRSSSGAKFGNNTGKRNSNASSMSQISSSSYHNFAQPLFSTTGFFYRQYSDISHWTELRERSNYILDLTWKALEDSNKQLFTINLSELTKTVSIIMGAARLTQTDFVDTHFERSIRHRMRHVATAFSQMYINSLLHLSMMHYSDGSLGEEFLSLDIYNLNKSTRTTTYDRPSASSRGSDSTYIQTKLPSETHSDVPGDRITSYLQQIESDIHILRKKMNGLSDIFLKVSKDKKIHVRDYDSCDVSEDEGEDRYNLMPQVYPRMITGEFNGGNWCNPFFTNTHRVLNISGEHLKIKSHSKIVIDSSVYDRAKTYTEDIKSFTNECLYILDPVHQHRYYNDAMRNERNDSLMKVMYKYLHHASYFLDFLESLDFTVFCLVNQLSVSDALGAQPNDDPPMTSPKTSLTFTYPVVLEFFEQKQRFHDSLANILINTQALTLDDPDAFSAMNEEDFCYGKDAMRDPLEKTAVLLSQILLSQLKTKQNQRIFFDQDAALTMMLNEGTTICNTILGLIENLIDERESTLNYSARLMNDFNVDLFFAERDNTSAALKSEDGSGSYFGGDNKSDEFPWFLQGDEEYDLLLDINGNIKGGTREALVAHLTHHTAVDSAFDSVFMLSFTTFMSFSELIDLLIQRFQIEAPESLSYGEYIDWSLIKQVQIRLKVLNFMQLILEKYWLESFNVKDVLARWLNFMNQEDVQKFVKSKDIVERLRKLVDGKQLGDLNSSEIPYEKAPTTLTKGFSLRKSIRLLDIEYVELARQFTLREFHLYSAISKIACIHKVWGKRSGVNESISSIQNFIRYSNQLTNFVAYSILRKEDARKRVKVIRHFVQVAEWCRHYNNFSSMTAIISALYSSPIHRLKKTWKYVTTDIMAKLQDMNKLMNSSRNFIEYRDILKNIGSEPCVPFFGVYLSDLTFVFHGNPDFLLNRTRMVNFAKRAKTVEIVTGIDRFKNVPYSFHNVPEIQFFLDLWFDKCPTIDQQYQLSLNIEPREERPRKDYTGTYVSRSQPMSVMGMR